MAPLTNTARDRLERGELAVGLGLRHVRSGEIARMLRSCGYDWLFIDLEHSAMSIETAAQIAVAGLDAGIAPLVRVPADQFWLATRLLDAGALGIVMPHVNTPDEARAIVRHLRYPPIGHRSVAGALPQLDFRAPKWSELTATIDAAVLVVVMLETPQAIANADAIAAVPGIDVLLIGTGDLAAEHGVPDDLASPVLAAAYATVVDACRKHRKWPGMGGVYDEKLMERYIKLGMRMILAGGDVALLMGAATQRLSFVRGCAAGMP